MHYVEYTTTFSKDNSTTVQYTRNVQVYARYSLTVSSATLQTHYAVCVMARYPQKADSNLTKLRYVFKIILSVKGGQRAPMGVEQDLLSMTGTYWKSFLLHFRLQKREMFCLLGDVVAYAPPM